MWKRVCLQETTIFEADPPFSVNRMMESDWRNSWKCELRKSAKKRNREVGADAQNLHKKALFE